MNLKKTSIIIVLLATCLAYMSGCSELTSSSESLDNDELTDTVEDTFAAVMINEIVAKATADGKDWIEFKQTFEEESGWAYEYTKRISLATDSPRFTIYHSLKNTGTKNISTSQYNHNFFMIDKEPIGTNRSWHPRWHQRLISCPRMLYSDDGRIVSYREGVGPGPI